MNKNLIYFIILLFTTQLFSQTDSTKIAFIAYWSIGDSYNFKVTKIKKSWKDNVLTKKDSSQYIANFKVLDSTKKSYTIQWSYKNTLINTFKKNMDKIYVDKKTVSNIISKYDVTKIVYKTNELGEFIEIINWKEIAELMKKLLVELEKSIQTNKPDKLKNVQKAMKPLAKIYSSKEGIEQLIMYELQFFHFPFGVEYEINEPIEYEQELPNMLGGKPITGRATLTFEDIDYEESYCVMKEKVIINPEDTKRLIIRLFKKMGIDKKKTNEIIETAILDITDLNYYQYYYNPGIPHRIYGSRKTIVKIDGKENKQFNELEIELIYEE